MLPIEHLTQAIRLNPFDSGSHIALARALGQAGRTADSQAELKAAQNLDDVQAKAGSSRILLGNAVDHVKQGERSKAIEDLRRATMLSPDYEEAQYQLARALILAHAPNDEVIPVLQRALEIKPDDARAHLQLGKRFGAMGKDSQEIAELRRAVELAPGLIEAHRALADAALSHRQLPLAIAQYRAALAWDPANGEARRGLARAQALAHPKKPR